MMAKTPIYIINSYYYGPALGQLGCSIYGFVGGLTGTTSIMTLASIAVDRYYAIVHPLNPFKRTTSRRATLMILFIWIYASIFSSLPLFGVNSYTSEGYLTSCSFDYLSENTEYRVFVFVFFLAAWFLPLSIILFSYYNIFRMVHAAEQMEIFTIGSKRHSAGESFKFKSDMGRHKNEVKIAVLAGALISLWLIAWTPYAIVALLGIFGGKAFLTPFFSAIPAIFCKTTSCINPFVYSMNHPKFQRELQSLFSKCFRATDNRRKITRESSFYSAVSYRGRENSVECINQSFRNHRNASIKTKSPTMDSEANRSTSSTGSWGRSNLTGIREVQVKSSLMCPLISNTTFSTEETINVVDTQSELKNELHISKRDAPEPKKT